MSSHSWLLLFLFPVIPFSPTKSSTLPSMPDNCVKGFLNIPWLWHVLQKDLVLFCSWNSVYDQTSIVWQWCKHPRVSGWPLHSIHAILVFIKCCYDSIFYRLSGPGKRAKLTSFFPCEQATVWDNTRCQLGWPSCIIYVSCQQSQPHCMLWQATPAIKTYPLSCKPSSSSSSSRWPNGSDDKDTMLFRITLLSLLDVSKSWSWKWLNRTLHTLKRAANT